MRRSRQIEVMLESGGVIEQETRRWDDAKGVKLCCCARKRMRRTTATSQSRICPRIEVSGRAAGQELLRQCIPELPSGYRLLRYVKEYGLLPVSTRNLLAWQTSDTVGVF